MAIGGSPRFRRVTAWHHTCCNTIRWSAQRVCDLCGTRADFWSDGVPIYVLMERLHAEDKQERVDAPAQRPPAAANAQAAARSSAPAALPAALSAPAPAPTPTPTPNPAPSSAPVSIPAPAASPAPSAIAAPAAARPGRARPHRNHEDDEAPALRAPRPSRAGRWSAFHTMWLAGAIALVSALGVAAWADHGGDPLLPMLIAVAAILLVVLAPMAMAGGPGEAAR